MPPIALEDLRKERRWLLDRGILAYTYVGDDHYGVCVRTRVGKHFISHHRLVSFGGRTQAELIGRLIDAMQKAGDELFLMALLIDSRECGGK